MLSVKLEVPTATLNAKVEAVDEAHRSGLLRVAGAAQQIAERKVGEIEKRPIPSRSQVNAFRRKGGGRRPSRVGGSGPAWERSGNLARAVEAAPVFENENEVDLTADVEYAEARHELGVSRMPAAPALGIVRRNPFFAETVAALEGDTANELYADGFNDVFEKA